MIRHLSSCLGLGLLAVGMAGPGFARDVYECRFPETANNLGYLADTVILARDGNSRTVTLVDAVIQQETGGPIEVEIVEENGRKFSMSWTVTVASEGNDFLRLSYRLSIQKGSLAATYTAKPLGGYSNNFSARGTCVLSEG